MAIKRTAADVATSDAVRESFDYVCCRCQRDFRHNPGGLDCSHVYGRGNWSTRFTVKNLLALCRGCHRYLTKNPDEHMQLYLEIYTQEDLDTVRLKKNTPAKGIKRLIPQIAAHYRKQTRDIEELRFAGHRGYIQPEDWEDVD